MAVAQFVASSAPRRVASARFLASATFAGGLLVAVARGAGPVEGGLVVLFAAAFGLIAGYDVLTLRAPNRVVYPMVAAGALFPLLLGPGAWLEAIAGGALVFVLLLLVAIVGRGAMGYGDVKAGTLVGLCTGASGALPALAATFIGGGLLAAVLLGVGVRKRRDVIAFTPFLGAGMLVSLAFFDGYLVR